MASKKEAKYLLELEDVSRKIQALEDYINTDEYMTRTKYEQDTLSDRIEHLIQCRELLEVRLAYKE